MTMVANNYSAEWMNEPQVAELMPCTENEFHELLGRPGDFALNMESSVQQSRKVGSLTTRYNSDYRGPLDPPAEWPTYRNQPRSPRNHRRSRSTQRHLPSRR